MTTTPQPTSLLPSICWVSRSRHIPALVAAVDEVDDYCPACVEIAVSELQQQRPQWAEEIAVDGGWEPCRQSDTLASCIRCGCELGCTIIGDDGTPKAECSTLAEWQAVDGDPQ